MNPKILVLCGGVGTRFAPFQTNKLLWPFFGKPFLFHLFEDLIKCGLTDVTAVCSADVLKIVKTFNFNDTTVKTIIQNEPLGMDDALAQAANKLDQTPYLVINGDDIVDPSLWQKIVADIAISNEPIHLTSLIKDEYVPFGYYVLNNEHVTGVIEKPEESKKPSNLVRLTADYFANIKDFINSFSSFSHSDARYEEALNSAVANTPASVTKYSGYWAKLKYPHDVLAMTHIFLHKRIKSYISPNAKVSPYAVIEGDVYIEDGAIVDAFAKIKGPTYIGKNVLIGSSTLVRESIIEEGTTIGFGSDVARAYVGPHCSTHHGYVGDSVLENNVIFGWGTVTANLKFDKRIVKYNLPNGTRISSGSSKFGSIIAQNAFIGAAASLMPGSVVLPNAKIMPGTVYKS